MAMVGMVKLALASSALAMSVQARSMEGNNTLVKIAQHI
jgi:hypothetical protein